MTGAAEIEKMNGFTASLSFCTHPLMKTRKMAKLLYFAALAHLAKSCAVDREYTEARLSQYRALLVDDAVPASSTSENCDAAINMIIYAFLKPWTLEYRSMLLCDIALILLDSTAIKKAFGMMPKYKDLCGGRQERLNELSALLFNDMAIPPIFACTENNIEQFRANHRFASQQTMRIMVTATMSAGKSTLINALIGKPITRMKQEACTASLCYLYNKPFEDNRVHLLASPLNLNATYDDLLGVERESASSIASYFRSFVHPQRRVCLIDTPGVDSALNSGHGELTSKAIVEENYDKLIYGLNAHYLGAEGKISHLEYVYRNVPSEKIIFVINKLDSFRNKEDSISASISGVKRDLAEIGFKNPVICPVSAYFSLLLKLKQNNDMLNEDEEDIFKQHVKKFNKPEYDLSKYYPKELGDKKAISDELTKTSFIFGLFGLENILYGGTSA